MNGRGVCLFMRIAEGNQEFRVDIYMRAAYIYMMSNLDNVFGAVALGISDQIVEVIQAETDLSAVEAATLVQVHFRPNETIKSLAAKLRLSHPGAVRVVDRLRSRGYIGRSPGQDKRQALLVLTDKGERSSKQVSEARARVLKTVLAALTDEDRDVLTPILSRLIRGAVRDKVDAYAHCRFCDTDLCYSKNCPIESFARDRHFSDFPA